MKAVGNVCFLGEQGPRVKNKTLSVVQHGPRSEAMYAGQAGRKPEGGDGRTAQTLVHSSTGQVSRLQGNKRADCRSVELNVSQAAEH